MLLTNVNNFILSFLLLVRPKEKGEEGREEDKKWKNVRSIKK